MNTLRLTLVTLTVLGFSMPALAGWTVPFRGGFYSEPVGYNGSIIIGSVTGAVHAFDQETGEEKWRYQTGQGLSSGPTIVVCNSQNVCTGGGASSLRRARIRATPVVRNDVVFIGSDDYYFYALDARTGQPKWATDLGGSIHDDAIVTEQTVIVQSITRGSGFGDYLHVLDAINGELLWSSRDKSATSDPAYRDGTIYFGLREPEQVFSLQAMDERSFDILWSLELSGTRANRPILSDDTVFVSAAVYSGVAHIYAVDAVSGTLQWEFGAGGGNIVPNMVVGSENVFVVTADGVAAVNKISGELTWFLSGDYQERSVQLNNNLYVENDDIFAINPADGEVIWTKRRMSLFRTTITDTAMYVGTFKSSQPTLVALDANTGERLWAFRPRFRTRLRNAVESFGPFNPLARGSLARATTPPLILDGQLIVPTERYLFSIDAETGKN